MRQESDPRFEASATRRKNTQGRFRARLVATLYPLMCILIVGCAGSPPPPDWKLNASTALAAYEKHYLAGNGKLAELNFTRARSEAARTGTPGVVARIELARCATRVAALEFDDCPAYHALAGEADGAARAYGEFLSGTWSALDGRALPPQYGGIVKATDDAARSVALAAIDDPLSRLVAAGVLLRSGRLSPPGIETAIATASGQGWRRPLLAWLGVEAKRAEAAGNQAELQRLRQRIELVESSLPR